MPSCSKSSPFCDKIFLGKPGRPTYMRLPSFMRQSCNRHHDPSPLAQIKVALSPVALPAVSARFMKETARLAETLDVRLHTHGWETLDERQWVQNVYGTTELALFDEWGWLQDRTWFAHAVHANREVIDLLGQRNVAISHCPTSNMRLGSGIAPIRLFLDAGNTVALGVDGSASNDGGHLLAEARQALLLARVLGGAAAMTVEEALHLATTQVLLCHTHFAPIDARLRFPSHEYANEHQEFPPAERSLS